MTEDEKHKRLEDRYVNLARKARAHRKQIRGMQECIVTLRALSHTLELENRDLRKRLHVTVVGANAPDIRGGVMVVVAWIVVAALGFFFGMRA